MHLRTSERARRRAAFALAAAALWLVVSSGVAPAQATGWGRCLDGTKPHNLRVHLSADRSEITVRAKGRLCHPVEVAFTAYHVPATWHSPGPNPSAGPERAVSTRLAVVRGTGAVHLKVKLPCGNVRVALYYSPVQGTVGPHGPKHTITSRLWHRNTCTPVPDPGRDPQSLTVTLEPGGLTLTTPYTPGHPLELGQLTVDGSADLRSMTTAFENIVVTDTRAGTQSWTASAEITAVAPTAGAVNGQNIGLTAVAVATGAGAPALADMQSLQLFENPAAYPPVDAAATGDRGLAGQPHAVAAAGLGRGTVVLRGRLAVTVPTTAPPVAYVGTLTLTVV